MESKFIQVVNLWLDRLTRAFVFVAGVLIIIMAFLATYGSLKRYAFNSPDPIAYEFSCMFLLLSFVLAIAAVERQDRFLRCDLLLERVPHSIRNIIMNIISPILGLTFFGIVTYMSYGDAIRALQIGQVSTSALPVPLFPVKIFIPVSYGLFCIILVMRLVLGFARIKKPYEEPRTLPRDSVI